MIEVAVFGFMAAMILLGAWWFGPVTRRYYARWQEALALIERMGEDEAALMSIIEDQRTTIERQGLIVRSKLGGDAEKEMAARIARDELAIQERIRTARGHVQELTRKTPAFSAGHRRRRR